jgi:tetratricopeptide (TPR) repeat protein
MSPWLAALSLAFLASAQEPAQKQEPADKQKQEEQIPPEEDEALKPKVYSFNPLQAEKELKIGNYYLKKGSLRAAATRFREATRWNANLAEAWLRLGETEERQKSYKAAAEAYSKYLELEPDAKNAADIRKKLDKLKRAKT